MTQKIQEAIKNSYSVKLGSYFARGFVLFKRNFGGYIAFTIAFWLIVVGTSFIDYLNYVSWLVIAPWLGFGFYLMSNQISIKDDYPEFGVFFNGYQHFVKITLIYLIRIVIYVLAMIPLISFINSSLISWLLISPFTFLKSLSETIVAIIFITVCVCIYIDVCLTFTTLIAVFHKKTPLDALKLGWKVIHKNFFMWLVLFLLLSVIGILGVLFFFIGFVFTYPFCRCVIYAAFEDVCGAPELEADSEETEINAIGKNIASQGF